MVGPTNPSENYFDKGLWGYDGTEWRKLNLLFGYYDRWAESLGGTQSGDGNYTKLCTAVPSGYVYVAQLIALRNTTGNRGMCLLQLYVAGVDISMAYKAAPVKYEPTIWTGTVVLKAGDLVYVTQVSCLNGDVMEGGVWGYKMKVT